MARAQGPTSSHPRSQTSELVGRTDELGRLYAALGRLAKGEASALALVGEPGIGKTALLDALCEHANEQRYLTLRGRAAQFERDVPFQVFVDALDDHLSSLNPRLLESLGEEARIELARLFPALSASAEARVPALDAERYRAHYAMRGLLRVLAVRTPVVLVVDDLHWVDEASQELLSFLLRRPPRARVLIALAYRGGQAPSLLVNVMEQAVADGACERVAVGPLVREDADTLLEADLPDPVVRSRVFSDTGGNPLYLCQLAAHPEAIAASPTARSPSDGVPASVMASIGGELAALDQVTLQILRGAAVAGDPFEPELAAAGAGVDQDQALERLDQLLERELLRPGDSQRRFQFRHPIVWRAVYESAPAGWRIGAHGRLAAHLRADGAPPTVLAPHLEAAAQPGDNHAIATLAEAGRHASPRAPASAARWLGAAVRLLPAGPESREERVGLLVPMAGALSAAGRLEESRDAMRAALDLIPAGAHKARTRAVVGCATAEFLLRRKTAGERLLLDTLAAIGDETSAEAAEIMFALGLINSFDYELDTARHWCMEALRITRLRGLSALEAGASAGLAYGEARLGNVAASTVLLDRASEIVDRLPDSSVAEQLDAVFWIVPTAFCLERYEHGLRHAERGLAIARTTGKGRWLLEFAQVRLITLYCLGRIEEGVRRADELLEMARLTGDHRFRVLTLAAAIALTTFAGQLGQALAIGDEAIELVGAGSEPAEDYTTVILYIYLARCLLAAGLPDASRAMYLEQCGGDELTLVDPVWKPLAYHDLALAEVALGDIEAASLWAARAEALAEQIGLPGRRGWALHARATVLLAQGLAGDAARVALAAAEASAAAHSGVDEGRAFTLAGRASADAGERDVAVVQLERAVGLLDECGARRFRDEAARWLRRQGRHVPGPGQRGRGGQGASGLSAREHEIAELVATGKANKEIAAELHLSVYTVENHLRKVFAKLGVSKRSAVAARLGGRADQHT